MIALFIAFGVTACTKTSRVVEKATVTRVGTLDGITTDKGGPVEGIEVTMTACPDVAWRIYLTSTGPTGVVAPAADAACMRSLAVGTSVDVTLLVTEKLSTRGSKVLQVGPCNFGPDNDLDGELKTTGPRICPWVK